MVLTPDQLLYAHLFYASVKSHQAWRDYCWCRFGDFSDTFYIIYMVGHFEESVGACSK